MEKNPLITVIPKPEDSLQPIGRTNFIMVSEDLFLQIAKEEIWNEFKKDPLSWVNNNASYYSNQQE
jgi:hypothetical protein